MLGENLALTTMTLCFFPPHSEEQQKQRKSSESTAAANSAELSPPCRPKSLVGLEVQANSVAFEMPEGESWRERASSDGKILKKSS